MPPKSPKTAAAAQARNAAETKSRILKAAKDLFSRATYKSIGTRDIAAAAGVNAALIHRYFGSKKNLFRAVISSLGSPRETLPPPASITRIMETIEEMLSPRPGLQVEETRLILLSALDPNVSDVVADFFQKTHRNLVQVIPGKRSESQAALIISAIMGLALYFGFLQPGSEGRLDREYVKTHFQSLFEQLFAAGPDD